MRLAERAKNISPSPTLAIDARAKKMIAAGEKVVNFGAGEPDFDTPEHIREAAIAAIRAGMTRYTPVAGTMQLRQAIVDKLRNDNGLDYRPEEIVVSAGAKHSLYNAMQVLLQPGDEVILPAPYWVSYLEQIKLAGAVPVIVQTRQENGFKLTVEELLSVVNRRTRMVIINSPGNPTGAVYTREELSALGHAVLEHGLIVISDEIYEKLLYDGLEHVSIASLSPALKEQTVVINGMSKAYAMTGWRIGYAAAPAPVAKAMADLQSHSTSNPTSIAQAASVAALTGTQEPVGEMVEEFRRRRDYMLERLQAIPGINCNRPGGAFYLFPSIDGYIGRQYKDHTIKGATDLAGILLDEVKVAVVPGVAFGDDRCFRLSYATSMENIREGLDRIEQVLKEIK
ncbi:aminotransferase class I/II-fold pyridoxal phosphate-dependent enzyme [Desulfofundulus thermobenzoicus]|uniref:Aminotransferase n=1 Tax=Desulfofundulus thermobenzoicus TaxID=29376 RepID=A0A6N7IXG5_9FIRM|nr:pyridoxal phosphate-dependent aminotransferase [Desulfofundulus thermobenzoicus]MQL53858.1 aminotransferase class I/II-fold pyridoxal phosphate-dependent enzyme [Desulfofundulus thermobenzoicus]HHW43017.1 pyridoxal phosphate-dependent aminotransferase [Desulfotomaculum sp.]